MRRFVPALLTCVVIALPAPAQRAPAPEEADEGVTVNMDALGLPAPAAIPEIPPEEPGLPRTRKPPARPISRDVPLPQPKPARAAPSVAAVAPAGEAVAVAGDPVDAAQPKPKADLPVAMIENFPVELRGTARDPFANAKTVDPAAGFALIERVRFEGREAALPTAAASALDALVERLATSKARLRLVAYSGNTGDMSSQMRRLSLERARSVRDHLVLRGGAFERIDVMPFGGPASGVSDRVDILAPGG